MMPLQSVVFQDKQLEGRAFYDHLWLYYLNVWKSHGVMQYGCVFAYVYFWLYNDFTNLPAPLTDTGAPQR